MCILLLSMCQVGRVCGELASMDELKGGFNMVGFSQGGQFLRVSGSAFTAFS
jgi:hypothetical protein